ncbi:MAG: hypothetical protein NC320_06630 [Clostridium sp.]|nr:hypothetical protein [Clostridium sp.]MCM1547079.1 hypothetical protein [Ruminococcus sp.]
MNRDYIDCGSMPHGLGAALSRNVTAMEEYSKMSKYDKNKFINGSRNISSKDDMNNYVNSLTSNA